MRYRINWKLCLLITFGLWWRILLDAQAANNGWRKEEGWIWTYNDPMLSFEGVIDAKGDLDGNTLILQGHRDPLAGLGPGGVYFMDSSVNGNTIKIDIGDSYYSFFDHCALSMNQKVWVSRYDSTIHVLNYQGQVVQQFKIQFPVRELVPDTLGNLFLVFGDNAGVGIAKFNMNIGLLWQQWYPIGVNASNVVARWGYDDVLYVRSGVKLLRINPLTGNVLLALDVGNDVEFAVSEAGNIHLIRKTLNGPEVSKLDSLGNLIWAKRFFYVPLPGSSGTVAKNAFITVDGLTGRIMLASYYQVTIFNGSCYVYGDCPQFIWVEPDGTVRGEKQYYDYNISGLYQDPRYGYLVAMNEDYQTCMTQTHHSDLFFGTHDQMFSFCSYSCAGCSIPASFMISWLPGITSVSSTPIILQITPVSISVSVSSPGPPKLCYQCAAPTINWSSQLTLPLTHQFSLNLNNYNHFHWNFGDGTTSTMLNPSHTFPGIGWYKVTLYATNACGTDSLAQWINLCANAQMNGPTMGCVGQPATFQSIGNPSGLPTFWLVNGINTASGQQFSWTPSAPGAYTLSMIVYNQVCNDTAFQIFTAMQPSPILPVDTAICANAQIMLNVGGGSWPHYNWSNGHIGNTQIVGPGSYWVECIDGNGCSGRDSITITALSVPDASFSYTTNGPITTFYALHPSSGTYLWSLGDGATDTNAQVTHAYTAPGLYNACLRIYGFNGCDDSTCTTIPIVFTSLTDTPPQLSLNVSSTLDVAVLYVRASLPSPTVTRFCLHDLAGRLLWERELAPERAFDFMIAVDEWAVGCYILSMEAGESRVVRRVMIW